MPFETIRKNRLTIFNQLQGLLRHRQFTLIELMAAITLAAIISSVVLGIFSAGMESWRITTQRTNTHALLRETLDDMVEGTDFYPGIREAAVLNEVSPTRIAFVPYHTDYFSFRGGLKVGRRFELKQPYQRGSASPLCEGHLRGGDRKRGREELDDNVVLVRAQVIHEPQGKTVLVIDENVPGDGQLSVLYFPDAEKNPKMKMIYAWEPMSNGRLGLTRRYRGKLDALPIYDLDSEIMGLTITYLDAVGMPLNIKSVGRRSSQGAQGCGVTAVEIALAGRSGDESLELKSMVNLRNLRALGKVVPLREGSQFYLPGSDRIAELSLLNFEGMQPGDRVRIMISRQPSASAGMESGRPIGKVYVINLQVGKSALANEDDGMRLQTMTVEYPLGKEVYRRNLDRGLGEGLNLMDLGHVDFDYDLDSMDDVVNFSKVKGQDIVLRIERLDGTGVGLIVQ